MNFEGIATLADRCFSPGWQAARPKWRLIEMRVTVSDSQIGSAFEKVKHMDAFEESRALFAQGKRPLEMIQAMCLHPEILRCFGEWGEGVYPGGLLERSIKEFIILEASRRNNCQFCRQSHIDF